MPGKQAKILSDDNIEDLLLYAAQTRYPRRNRVIALLSVKAGLRAGEIAKLTWEMVIAPDGTINTVIELRNHAAKKGSGRHSHSRRLARRLDCLAQANEWDWSNRSV